MDPPGHGRPHVTDPPSRPETWRIVLSVFLLIVAIAFRIWSRATDTDDTPPVTPATMAPTHPYADTVSPRTLPPGTCLDRAPSNWVQTVACDQPHVAEIVAVFPYPAPPGGSQPAVTELFRRSMDQCRSDFSAYIATTPDQTPATYFVTVPSGPEWDRGERLVVCYATARNGGDLTASVRGHSRT